MLRIGIAVCMLAASVTGVACFLIRNSTKQEDQSAWSLDDKGYDGLEEQNYQPPDRYSRDNSKGAPKGEPVWLLRHIDDEGNPRQWALYIFGKVYELRVVRNSPFPYAIICSPRYEAHVTDGVQLYPKTGFHRMGPMRPCVGGTPESHMTYYLRGCYTCMVGRTRLTPDEVQQAFHRVKVDFGVFIATLLCQSFLDNFLKRIIPRKDRAARRKKSIRQTITGQRLTMFDPKPRKRPRWSQVNHSGLFEGPLTQVLESQTQPDSAQDGDHARQTALAST